MAQAPSLGCPQEGSGHEQDAASVWARFGDGLERGEDAAGWTKTSSMQKKVSPSIQRSSSNFYQCTSDLHRLFTIFQSARTIIILSRGLDRRASVNKEVENLVSQTRSVDAARQVRVVDTLISKFTTLEETSSRAEVESILFDLVMSAGNAVRLAAAERLAELENAPRELIVKLANDEFTIAEPLLKLCRALVEDDLIRIIEEATLEHRVCIAGRADIGEQVTTALTRRVELDVFRTLIENESALLSPAALEACVEACRDHVQLHRPFASRKKLPTEIVRTLFTIVDIALRAELARNNPEVISALSQKEGKKDSLALARELSRSHALSNDFLVRSLNAGRLDLFFAALAIKSGIEIERAEIVLKRHGVMGVSLLCRAAELTEFLHLRSRRALIDREAIGMEASDGALEKADFIFQRLSPSEAADRLRSLDIS
jgi:uncharacterized protein (DUF2336 family)